MKVVALGRRYWPRGGFGHWCPACETGHEIDTEQPNSNGAMWKFDGNIASPTFTPSVNLRWGIYADPKWRDGEGKERGGICHYFITAGKIVYCGDRTHALKGQTVELPDIPEGKYLTSVRLARKGS